jgi:hypothetical protein
MPNFAGNLIGYPQVNRGRDAGAVEEYELGTILHGQDKFWGGGEYVYCIATAALVSQALVTVVAGYSSTRKKWIWKATPCPNTANLGQSVGVATTTAAQDDYLWVQISGIAPVNCNANVAVNNPIGVVAAGQAGALSAGKQVLNARSCGASSTTVAKTGCQATKGSKELIVSDADGWFIGLYLSGTGITTGSTVADISPDGRIVTLSADTSAAVNGTVTGTYNNSTVYYNVVMFDRPTLQGQIS